MQQSEQINELAAALSKAQGEIEGAKKDSVNPFFKSHYADLSSVIAAIKEPLVKHGLSVTQMTSIVGHDSLCVVTQIMHSSGQWMRGYFPITPKDNSPQALGSATSYSRRYSLQAAFCVSALDDDAEGASSHKPAAQGKQHNNVTAAPQQTAAASPTHAAPSVPVGKPTTVQKSSQATSTTTAAKTTSASSAGATSEKKTQKSETASQAFRSSPLPEGTFGSREILITQVQQLVGTKKIPIPSVTEIITLNWAPAKMLKDLDAKQLTKLHETLAAL